MPSFFCFLCFFKWQMSSLHPCCRGIQETATGSDLQVNRPETRSAPRLKQKHESLSSGNADIASVCFPALNLFYIIIPIIPLIVLLLTVAGVCCFKLLARRWGTHIWHDRTLYVIIGCNNHKAHINDYCVCVVTLPEIQSRFVTIFDFWFFLNDFEYKETE